MDLGGALTEFPFQIQRIWQDDGIIYVCTQFNSGKYGAAALNSQYQIVKITRSQIHPTGLHRSGVGDYAQASLRQH